MTRVAFEVPPAIRLAIGLALVVLSLPSFATRAVNWVFAGIDDRALGVAVAAVGCGAAYDGFRGLLRARSEQARPSSASLRGR